MEYLGARGTMIHKKSKFSCQTPFNVWTYRVFFNLVKGKTSIEVKRVVSVCWYRSCTRGGWRRRPGGARRMSTIRSSRRGFNSWRPIGWPPSPGNKKQGRRQEEEEHHQELKKRIQLMEANRLASKSR